MTQTTTVNENAPCRWESGELGCSLEHARPVSTEHESAVDDALGLQCIQIRLPKALVEDLELIANEQGLGSPALIRRVLARFVAAEFRARARDELLDVDQHAPTIAQLAENEPQSTYG